MRKKNEMKLIEFLIDKNMDKKHLGHYLEEKCAFINLPIYYRFIETFFVESVGAACHIQ